MIQVAAAAPAEARRADPPRSIVTRFGAITLDAERLVTFPKGLLGFAPQQRFALTDLPEAQTAFKLLQSVDDVELAFLVLPIDPDLGPIERSDLELACAGLGFAWPSLAVLGIVTVRASSSAVSFTVNLKAPLLIDTRRRIGHQHVFARDAYSLHHPLHAGSDHAG